MTHLLLLLLMAAHANVDVADPTRGATSDRDQLGSNMVGTSAAELACLMSKGEGVRSKDALKTAQAIEQALGFVRFKPNTFTRVSLMHFLSQVMVESDSLRTDEQYGKQKPEKKGWAMIQVTGSPNLIDGSACMEKYAQGRGMTVIAGAAGSIGNRAPDRVASALISLCWWKTNMTQNPAHSEISRDDTDAASRSVTQIVNAGGIGRNVTHGETNLRHRADIFRKLMTADAGGQCRRI